MAKAKVKQRMAVDGRPLLWGRDVAVCIPSAGRPDVLSKTLRTMPFLNDRATFIGIQADQCEMYQPTLAALGPRCRVISYNNPHGSIALCREELRKAALGAFPTLKGKWVVVTDDNAKFTHIALQNLVNTAHTWKEQPCIVAGMHGTAAHFDRHRLGEMTVCNGYRSYPQIAMIFQTYPAELYAEYSYPQDAYGLDDRHLILWAIEKGLRRSQFRVAMDAPFTKARYQAGGQGNIRARAQKNGWAIARLASDFPEIVGTKGTLPIPWQQVFALREGKNMDRLAGGSMRKASALIREQ